MDPQTADIELCSVSYFGQRNVNGFFFTALLKRSFKKALHDSTISLFCFTDSVSSTKGLVLRYKS